MAVIDEQQVERAPVRIDGRAKVTGSGVYTGDLTDATLRRYLHVGEVAPALLHAVTVPSTIAAGTVVAIDHSAATALPGVRLVLTHENAPPLNKVDSLVKGESSKYLPLQKPAIVYRGQPVAVVIADSFEIATQAADLVRVTYVATPALTDFNAHLPEAEPVKKVGAGEKAKVEWGNAEQAYKVASVRVDDTYTTAPAHHNAMEPGTSIAHWHAEDGEENRLTVITCTQFVYGDAVMLAEAFDIGHTDKILSIVAQVAVGKRVGGKVRVVSPLVGGAFGSKAGSTHVLLAAMASRVTGHPVKLVLSRPQTFSQMPYRGGLQMRVRLGASGDGKLQALLQDAVVQSSTTASFLEPVGEITPHLYDVPNLAIDHRALFLDVNSPGWMRAPGVAPGQFAVECAMDDLAHALKLDPIDLRLRNYAETDPESGKEWSSKALRECYRVAADRFGWHRRQPQSTEREGTERIGYGMATAAYPTNQFPAMGRVTLLGDGTFLAQSSAQEVGQGAITTLSTVVADALGLPLTRVRLEIGDTTLPFGAFAGGSATSLSVGSALQQGVEKLGVRLARLARVDAASPLHRCALRDIVFTGGNLRHRSEYGRVEDATTLMLRHGLDRMEATGTTGRRFGKSKFGRCAFGAQFARVAVCDVTGRVRVTHMTSAFAGGKILNARTARSQLLGGMVWGIGHALMEETILERHSGGWLNSNLGEAHVPSNADIPELEVLFVEEDDRKGSELGAKGLGEIGIVGVAAAISNGVFNATGSRLRDLPMTPDQMLRAVHVAR